MNAYTSAYKRINRKMGSDCSEPFGNGVFAPNSLNSLKGCGGQHRPAVGISTWDSETAAERAERHRRTYAELGERPTFPVEGFDIDSAPEAEPRPTATESDLVALEQFNRELQAAIDAVDWSQPF